MGLEHNIPLYFEPSLLMIDLSKFHLFCGVFFLDMCSTLVSQSTEVCDVSCDWIVGHTAHGPRVLVNIHLSNLTCVVCVFYG